MSKRRSASDRADLLAALVLAGDDAGAALRLAQVLGYRPPMDVSDDQHAAGFGQRSDARILQGHQRTPVRSSEQPHSATHTVAVMSLDTTSARTFTRTRQIRIMVTITMALRAIIITKIRPRRPNR